MKQITIFTPTYNRQEKLKRCYVSLCNQTCKYFVWIIVDDGSTDGTENVVRKWMYENKISIVYKKQQNYGKSAAHNKGVELCKTELFSCLDSDDYLINTAIEELLFNWNKVRKNCLGIVAFRKYETKELTTLKKYVKFATLTKLYRYYGLKGDTMLIYKTEILKRYKFPKFKNEKFVPESYIYDRIDKEGKLFVYPKAIYVGEYLVDGYTNNMNKVIKDNPLGYIAYINQRIGLDKGFVNKFLDSIRYVGIALVINNYSIVKKSKNRIITVLAYPAGIILNKIKYK